MATEQNKDKNTSNFANDVKWSQAKQIASPKPAAPRCRKRKAKLNHELFRQSRAQLS